MAWWPGVIFLVGLLSTIIASPHLELVALSLGVMSFLWAKGGSIPMTAAALGLGARLLLVKLTWGVLLTVLVVVNIGVTSIKDNPSPKEAVLAAGTLGCGGLFIAFGLANTFLSGLQGFL